MVGTGQQLTSKLIDCTSVDEQAALLTELAELKLSQGRSDEAQQLLQQAYDVRLGPTVDTHTGTSQQNSHESTTNTTASIGPDVHALPAPQQPAACALAAAGERSSSSAGADWEQSDEWEPDLTALRKASSLQREAAAAAPVNGRLQQEAAPAAAAAPSSGGSWRSNSSAATGANSSSWRAGSSGTRTAGSTPSRPRGRGESRLDAASDSDTEWESILGVPNQPHIVEIHALNRGVKTSHLDDFLLDYMWGDTKANIKWVDDEHALAVFPCAEAAQQLMQSAQTKYKVRPYSKASGGALQIAAEELTPPRSARPKTTTAVARRLISNALGNQQVRDRAAERELADLRKANKQERQQRQQQMEAVWDDDD